jgi:endoglucanase
VRPSSSFALIASTALASACSAPSPGGGGDPQPPPMDWVVHNVRVDSVGYVTGRSKVATVVLPAGMSALSDTTAEVFDLNGNLEWACAVTGPFSDGDLGITYYFADFSPFDGPGTFTIAVPALGSDATAQSAPFPIGPNVFAGALQSAMTGMYGQRCGTAVKITMGSDTWQHGACHQHDANSLKFLTGADKPSASAGGWHDAGDYGKYVNNGAFSVGMLLGAWEHFQPTLAALSLPIPEHGKIAAGGSAPLPDFLWEVKWELDWLLTAQSAGGSGGLPDKLTALAFETFGTMPEGDGQTRYFSGIGTAMTANFVAVMAEAARLYQADAPQDAANYLAAAQLGYAYLGANAGPAPPTTTRRCRPTSSRPGTTLKRTPTTGSGRRPRCGRPPAIRRRWPTSRRAPPQRPWRPTSTGRTSPTWASTPICSPGARTPPRAHRRWWRRSRRAW